MADQLGASVGTAAAGQVLTGYTFSNSSSQNVSGTMANQGSPTLQPGASITPGYYSGGSAGNPPNGSQTFSSNGTFTVPSGVSKITVVLAGGGAGGMAGGSSYGPGGGGGSGGVAIATIPVSAGQQFNINLGAGGSSATNPGADAVKSGGDSTFWNGSFVITAEGGWEGTYISGAGVSSGGAPGAVVTSGTFPTGAIVLACGCAGFAATVSQRVPATGSISGAGGAGGDSPFANGGNGGSSSTTAGTSGQYGSGGGGGGSNGMAGGTGGNGYCGVYW